MATGCLPVGNVRLNVVFARCRLNCIPYAEPKAQVRICKPRLICTFILHIQIKPEQCLQPGHQKGAGRSETCRDPSTLLYNFWPFSAISAFIVPESHVWPLFGVAYCQLRTNCAAGTRKSPVSPNRARKAGQVDKLFTGSALQ